MAAAMDEKLAAERVVRRRIAVLCQRLFEVRRRRGFAVLLSAVLVASGLFYGVARVHGHQAPLTGASNAQQTVLARARILLDALRARGRLSVPVSVQGKRLGTAGALTSFDFATRTCAVALDDGSDTINRFRNVLFLRFVVYHELSHCELYARPGVFHAVAGISQEAAHILEDLVLLDIVDEPDTDRQGRNLFVFEHEAYADVRALALLREEGFSPDELRFVQKMRDDSPFDFDHATSGLIAASMQREWTMPDDSLEQRSRNLVARFLVDGPLRVVFASAADLGAELYQVLLSRRLSVAGRLAAGEPVRPESFIGRAAQQRDKVAAYPSIRWLALNKHGNAACNPMDFAQNWMTASYGSGDRAPQAFDEAAGALRLLMREASSPLPVP